MEWTSNWNICKIGDIAEIIGGGTPRTEIDSYWDGDIKWFTPSEIGKSKYIFESERHITEKGLKNSSAKLLPKYTILLSSRASVGEVSIALTECSTNQGFQSLITKNNVDNEFIYYLISTMKNEFLKKSSGSTFLEISKNELKRININIPTLDEQKRISDFFSTLDNKIKLLNNKHKYYQDFKKYLLQQIFTSAEKLQFDFNEEWREVTFKELLIELNEKTTTNNQHKILSSTKEGIFSQKEYFANRNVASKDNTGYKILRKNQIVLSPQNLWMGNINVNTDFEIGIVSPSYKIYETTDLVEINYFKHIIKLSRLIYEYKCASEQGASIVRRNLNKQLFEEIKINIPSLKEQEKIANFLSAVDKKIDLIQTQIDEMEKFKKGLLQQMFISRINSLIIITIILISLESSHVFRFFLDVWDAV